LQLAKSVEKAIKTSPLSLTPVTEGSEVLVQLPRMTQETIDRMVKLVHMEAEGAHQSIRRARQKAMDAIKKAFKSASQDEKKRQEKEVRGAGLGAAQQRWADCMTCWRQDGQQLRQCSSLGMRTLCTACLGDLDSRAPTACSVCLDRKASIRFRRFTELHLADASANAGPCCCACRFRSCMTTS
jgi:hypothetical protein